MLRCAESDRGPHLFYSPPRVIKRHERYVASTCCMFLIHTLHPFSLCVFLCGARFTSGCHYGTAVHKLWNTCSFFSPLSCIPLKDIKQQLMFAQLGCASGEEPHSKLVIFEKFPKKLYHGEEKILHDWWQWTPLHHQLLCLCLHSNQQPLKATYCVCNITVFD